MASNDFVIHRTAYGSFAIANAASTHSTGCIFPVGAIITGVTVIAPGAVTLTGGAATLQPSSGAGGQILTAAVAVSDMPLGQVVSAIPLTTGSNYISATNELVIIEGVTDTSAVTGAYEVYVDYLYVT